MGKKRYIEFLKAVQDIKDHLQPAINNLEWKGKRPRPEIRACRVRLDKSIYILDEMMKYIVDRVMDGDICMLPRNKTYIFVGHNAPTAIERMKNRRDYPYKPGIIPGFIKVSRDDGEHSYMSLLLSLKDKQRLIDKVNSGIKYVQPIPLHTSYDNRNTWNEKVAWKKLTAEKQKIEECSTLTWTI